MSVSLNLVIAVIWLHLLSDFFLQSDWMAKNKSSNNQILTLHVATYSLPFWFVFGWKYALVNGILHWWTDFFSSRATTYLYKKNEIHWFFCVVGVDQAIHLTCLLLTMSLAVI